MPRRAHKLTPTIAAAWNAVTNATAKRDRERCWREFAALIRAQVFQREYRALCRLIDQGGQLLYFAEPGVLRVVMRQPDGEEHEITRFVQPGRRPGRPPPGDQHGTGH
jgi:hypothetical protein